MHKIGRLLVLILLSASCCGALAADIVDTDPAVLLKEGVAAYRKSDYQNAIKYLSARARLAPEDATVYYYLANCYMQLKQSDQAAHMYSNCVRVAPNSQAGKFSLQALETLSTMPKSPEPAAEAKSSRPNPEAVAAANDALTSTRAVDAAFNEAAKRVIVERQGLKTRIDHLYLQLQDDLRSLNPRAKDSATEMERLRREAEIKVAQMQLKELRYESRFLAPDKIDVRAIPQLPQEKPDDTKIALGTLSDYFKSDKPYDPFGTEVTPELTAKFMTLKDVFGETSTYDSRARKISKQMFFQVKSNIENKQDWLDSQISQTMSNLLRDILEIKTNYGGNTQYIKQQMSAAFQLTLTSIPRADNDNNLTQLDVELSQATQRAKKKIKDLEEDYQHEVDLSLTGAKERLAGMIGTNLRSQLKHPSGTIQLVPQGSDLHTRNYVNFGDHFDLGSPEQPSSHSSASMQNWNVPSDHRSSRSAVVPMKATAKRYVLPAQTSHFKPQSKAADQDATAPGSK